MWSAVVVISLLVIAVTVLAVQFVKLQREHDTAVERIDEFETRLGTANEEVASLSASLQAARDEVAELEEELATARGDLNKTSQHLAAARDELDTTQGELRDARAAAHDATALWTLELARSERRWRQSVSPGLDTASPFAGTDDPLRLAVEVEAAALREEVGTRVDIEWAVPPSLTPETSLVVLRLAQEMLSGAAQGAETLDLRVSAEDDDVVIDLRALDENDDDVSARLPELPAGRVRVEAGRAHVSASTPPSS